MTLKETRDEAQKAIGDWTEKHIGTRLEATATKLFSFEEFWDDRARRVQPNTGKEI